MDMESRRDGCGVYEFGQFMLDVIETVSRSGYRFTAEVRHLTAVEAVTSGVRRCLRANSPGELATSGGTV